MSEKHDRCVSKCLVGAHIYSSSYSENVTMKWNDWFYSHIIRLPLLVDSQRTNIESLMHRKCDRWSLKAMRTWQNHTLKILEPKSQHCEFIGRIYALPVEQNHSPFLWHFQRKTAKPQRSRRGRRPSVGSLVVVTCHNPPDLWGRCSKKSSGRSENTQLHTSLDLTYRLCQINRGCTVHHRS